jgi:hypothetical protein
MAYTRGINRWISDGIHKMRFDSIQLWQLRWHVQALPASDMLINDALVRLQWMEAFYTPRSMGLGQDCLHDCGLDKLCDKEWSERRSAKVGTLFNGSIDQRWALPLGDVGRQVGQMLPAHIKSTHIGTHI